MTPTIMKFGGTSLEDTVAFERVLKIVRAARKQHPVVVVVSAMSRVTDALLASVERSMEESADEAEQLLDEHLERYKDVGRAHLSAKTQGATKAAIESARREIRGGICFRAPARTDTLPTVRARTWQEHGDKRRR